MVKLSHRDRSLAGQQFPAGRSVLENLTVCTVQNRSNGVVRENNSPLHRDFRAVIHTTDPEHPVPSKLDPRYEPRGVLVSFQLNPSFRDKSLGRVGLSDPKTLSPPGDPTPRSLENRGVHHLCIIDARAVTSLRSSPLESQATGLRNRQRMSYSRSNPRFHNNLRDPGVLIQSLCGATDSHQ